MAKSRRIRKPDPTTDRRSPEERLEAFVREKYADRAERMWARILDGLDAVPEPAPWISAARTLSERLVISEDAFYWLVEELTQCLLSHASKHDPKLVQLDNAMTEIERAHGLSEGEQWETVSDGPEEWRLLGSRWTARSEEVVEEFLRGSGNGDVVDARYADPRGYIDRLEKGERELWKPDLEESPPD